MSDVAIYVSHFFGGAFLMNAVPHVVTAVCGRPFQSPFAKPPGQGLSSSTVNALWGWFNLGVAYLLLVRVGAFDVRNNTHVAAAGVGAFLMTIMAARSFGRFHGGNMPENK